MKRIDLIFLAAIGTILAAGLATLYSIGVTSGEPLVLRQAVYGLIGAGLFWLGYSFDYRLLAAKARYFYLAALAALGAVIIFGDPVRGSSRWIQLAGFNFQPSELAKVALIIVLARFFATKREEIKKNSTLVHSAVFAGIPAFLIALQPDLGSALMLVAIWAVMLLLAPVRKTQIMLLAAFFVGFASLGWNVLLHDYQRERVLTFLQPEADPQGSGYNVRQSMIAVGSGQLFGRGLGHGVQSHLSFLPERHTDFIFASFAEEMGFAGCLVLLVAFGFLLHRTMFAARHSQDRLGMYLCVGVAALLMAQLTINVGMNIGLMPVTGITLPLMSYGGSSLITTLFLLGLTQSVYRFGKGTDL